MNSDKPHQLKKDVTKITGKLQVAASTADLIFAGRSAYEPTECGLPWFCSRSSKLQAPRSLYPRCAHLSGRPGPRRQSAWTLVNRRMMRWPGSTRCHAQSGTPKQCGVAMGAGSPAVHGRLSAALASLQASSVRRARPVGPRRLWLGAHSALDQQDAHPDGQDHCLHHFHRHGLWPAAGANLKVPCAPKRFDSRVSYTQKDELPSQNSLMHTL